MILLKSIATCTHRAMAWKSFDANTTRFSRWANLLTSSTAHTTSPEESDGSGKWARNSSHEAAIVVKTMRESSSTCFTRSPSNCSFRMSALMRSDLASVH